jgi:DnaJ homolog subfamily C member 3
MLLHLSTTLSVAAGLLASVAAIEIPSDVPVSTLLSSAQSLLSRGETSEALAYYDAAVARDPSNYLTLFKRGATNLSLGRTTQATDDFHKVLSIEPGFEGAHLQLAKIKSRTADWDVARAEYVAARKPIDSPEIQELDEAEGAASLAEVAAQESRWEDCVNHAGVAILVANRAPALRQLRSRCRFERGEIEEGIADLQHLLAMRPGDLEPHVVIAATTFYGLGDMEAGMSQVKKCLHSDPESKLCKRLRKQQKAIHKAFGKVEGQLQRGQTTTAGRSLAGTSDDPGLISDIKEQVDNLRKAGSIPPSATIRLYDNAIELTCQAYSEVYP